jgi:DNA-binding LacI/PurR family transcriptional regulator
MRIVIVHRKGMAVAGASDQGVQRPPAITDVARLAGVSHQTVSRVVNDHHHVRETTRLRVRAAMDELGYRPNRAARALVTGRSGLLGTVAIGTTQYGPASIIAGLEKAARQQDYSLAVAPIADPDADAIRSAVDRLLRQGIDGLIVLAPFAASEEALNDAPTLPLVVVEGDAKGRFPTVNVDQVGGSRLAVRHLLDLGHTGVWHIAGHPDWWEAKGRLSGWQEEMRASGLTTQPHLGGDWSARSGYEAGRVLSRIREATAVFAANDQIALGLLHALREAGRNVPGDVSVVGFDDIPEAPYLSPPLTTVRQDFDEVGRQAMKLLLQQINNESPLKPGDPATNVQVTSTLLVRKSTAAPHASHTLSRASPASA